MSEGIGARKLLDIEDVLSWAVIDLLRRERQVDGRIIGVSTMSPMFRLLLVGRGGRGGGFVPMGGPPHPDALKIEAAIIRLRRFAGLEISGSCGLVEDIGLEVDELGAVRHALRTMPDLVIVHARTGRRPPAGIERPHPQPLFAPNGRPSVMVPAIVEG